MKYLLLFPLCLIGLCGCSTTNLAKIIHESKGDPADWDLDFNGWGATVHVHRKFPTNWTPTNVVVLRQ